MAVLGNPQLSAILLAQVTSIAPSQYKTEKVVKNLDSGSLSPSLHPSFSLSHFPIPPSIQAQVN